MIIQRRTPKRVSSANSGGITLGIDQSYSNLAIVQLDSAGVVAPVVGHFPGKKEWGAAESLLRFYDIEDWLAGVCTAWQSCTIDAICMEGYARGKSFQREESGELSVVVRKALFEHLGRVPCIVNTMQVKKFATGSSKAAKQEMLLAVYKRWGYETRDDNVADALTLAKIARALCDGDAGLIGAQRDVLTALGHDRSWRLTREQLREMGTLPVSKRSSLLL